MRFILIGIVIGTISCQSINDNNRNSKEIISEKREKDLPAFVKHHKADDLVGWVLLPESNWPDSIYSKYESDSTAINSVLTDINCDGKPDYTGIFKDTAGNMAIIQIHSLDRYYTSTILESFEKSQPIDFGIKSINDKTSFVHSDGSLEIFKCGAIERFDLRNKAKKIFYNDEKGLHVIENGK